MKLNSSNVKGCALATLTTVAAFLRFVLPANKSQEDWTSYNTELNSLLKPIHRALAADIIPPNVAGDQIGLTIQQFLLSKPEFNEDRKSSSFISHEPKTLEKVKTLKNQLWKSARKSQDPQERKRFYQAIRTHNFLKKQQRQKEKHKTASWQEDVYHKNFFEFSKSTCNDTLGKSSPLPSFDKAAADTFYQSRYSQTIPIDTSKLNWYPRLETPETFTAFVMDPFTPKSIRNLIKSKSNNSSPGPDGITYGLLKKTAMHTSRFGHSLQ